jgi:hypothetical protein
MPQPEVHFGVIGKDPTRLRKYLENSSAGNSTCPRPWREKYRNRQTTGFLAWSPRIGVPDVEVAMQRAEKLGGHESWVQHNTEWPRGGAFHRS